MSAQHKWDALRACWIDVYTGPPDTITHDSGSNFSSQEFRGNASSMAINIKDIRVEAHDSIGLIERYHAPLRREFQIIRDELKEADKELILQMAVKTVNDTAGPDSIVPILLAFDAYLRISLMDPPASNIVQRAKAMKAAMKKVQQLYARRQVVDALRQRNGPKVDNIQNTLINSLVLVWRERENWTGPYKLLNTEGQTCTIEMPNGPTNFRSNVVKPYYSNETETENDNSHNHDRHQSQPRRNPPRIRIPSQRAREAQLDQDIFLSTKETRDLNLSKELRSRGVIVTAGKEFEASAGKEIDELIARNVFRFEKYDQITMKNLRLFNSRLVDEVKGKGTDMPYEKS